MIYLIIDNAPNTEDVFTDEDLFCNEDIENDSKQIIDNILKDINMQYEPKTTTATIKKEPESLNFKNVLLPKRKKKKSSLLAANETIRKKY